MRRAFVVWCHSCTWRNDTASRRRLVELMRMHEHMEAGHLTECMYLGAAA